jgi:hypothetical protein
MPVVEDCKFNRNNIASSSFNPFSRMLDLGTQVKPPGCICPRSIENSGDVVFQYYGSKKANVDVSR